MALHGYDRPTSVKEIAERTGLPQPYLEQILLAVKGAGLARSKRGVGGGYVLARPPEEITLADIVAAADGPITTYFDSHDHREGHCALQDVWVKVSESMRSVLEGFTLADLVDLARIGHLDAADLGHDGRSGSYTASRGLSTAASSGGSGSVNSRRSPVTGWVRARAWAWRNGRPGAERVTVAAVGGVAHDGVADGGEVDTDLVGAARLQPALDQGADRVVVLGEDLVAGAGVLPRLPHGHPGPAGGGPADGGVDRAPAGVEAAPGQGQVPALDLPGGQGGGEGVVGPAGCGPPP